VYYPTKHSNDKITTNTGEYVKIVIRKPERTDHLGDKAVDVRLILNFIIIIIIIIYLLCSWATC